MKTILLATFLIVALYSSPVQSQPFNQPKLDSLLSLLAEKNKAMGSLTLSRNGKILYSRSIGYSVISEQKKVLATENTMYRIGSATKMFTAVMILQFIEEGKLALTTTLDMYFPTLPNAHKITISHLLNHRSGLHNFTNDQEYTSWMTEPKSHEEIINIISEYKTDFEPGERQAYCNSNYVLLGYIIERVSEKSYAQNLSERICSRIGLLHTKTGGKIDPKNHESFSYKYAGKWEEETETDMSIPGGAGIIISTPNDLVKFIEAVFALKLISMSSLTTMITLVDGYGMGIFQTPFYNKRGYGHNGNIDGFASNLIYFPEDSLAIAYCANGEVYPLNNILMGVLSIYFNKKYVLPLFQSITLKTEDLDIYLGIYSSKENPLKIKISKQGSTLIAQASGQSEFPLDAIEPDVFSFDPAALKLEFKSDKGEMILRQGGGSFLFIKDK